MAKKRWYAKRDIKKLIVQLEDKNKSVREAAAWRLTGTRDKRAVPALIKAVEDKNKHVRQGAIIALGWIGDERAVVALRKALKDENEVIQQTAKGTLKILKIRIEEEKKKDK